MKTAPFQIKSGSPPVPDSDTNLQADLVLAFGAPSLLADETQFLQLKARFPQAVVAGCTSTGEIYQGSFHEDSLSGVAISFDTTTCRSTWRPHHAGFWQQAALLGRGIAQDLAAPDLKIVLLFVDGLGLEIDGFLEGMHEGFGDQPPLIYGGAAGDYYSFTQTSVLCDDGILPSGIVAVGLYGDELSYTSSVSECYTQTALFQFCRTL